MTSADSAVVLEPSVGTGRICSGIGYVLTSGNMVVLVDQVATVYLLGRNTMKKFTKIPESPRKMFAMRIPKNELVLLKKSAAISRCDQTELARHWIREHFGEHILRRSPFEPKLNSEAKTTRKIWSLRVPQDELDMFKKCADAAGWSQTDLFRYWIRQYFDEHASGGK